MDTYNEKYIKETILVADFLLHVSGFFIIHNTWDPRVMPSYADLELCCLYF